jgi:predicted ester cyclase
MMGTTENKAVAARFIDEVFNNGNYKVIDELLAADFVAHVGGTEQGRDAFGGMVRSYRDGFPDYHCVINDQMAEGDRVATRWTFSGTHDGQLMGMAPTGRRVTVTGVAIDRIADGKLVESWLEMDAQRMLHDLNNAS